MDKDYYRILGVLDDAEDIVIKAAYRALAQKYHPDRWQGNAAEATRRMAEINAAYAVLSDPDKRRAYDATRDKSDFQDDSADTDDSQDAFAAIDKDWALAIKYIPELITIEVGLRRIARELGTTFKLILLEHKNFDDYRHVAEVLERVYLKKYFGSTQIAQDFAKELILEGRRDAARELNQIVRVLGTCNHSIVDKIRNQFKAARTGNESEQCERLKVICDFFFRGLSTFPAKEVVGEVTRYSSTYGGDIRCVTVPEKNVFLGQPNERVAFYHQNGRMVEARDAHQYFRDQLEKMQS